MCIVKNMTRPQVEAAIKRYPVAILPIGSCEQHGPHLPLGTDTILAEALANRVANQCGALVYPPLNFGYSWVWRDIAGTISIDTESLITTLEETVASMQRYGIKLLVFLNGHEANNASIKYAVRRAQDASDIKLLGMFYPGLKDVYSREMESETWGGMFHACEFETSLMLATDPGLVDMSLAVAEYPNRPALYGMDNTSIGDLSKTGVYGDPTLATVEKGQRMFAAFTKNIVEIIETTYKGITE